MCKIEGTQPWCPIRKGGRKLKEMTQMEGFLKGGLRKVKKKKENGRWKEENSLKMGRKDVRRY